MNRLLLISVSIFLSALATNAQADQAKIERVIWGPDENCHPANSIEVKAGSPKCSLVNVPNPDQMFRIVRYKGISISIDSKYTVSRKRNYVTSTVQISNASGAYLEVDPATWTMNGYENETNLLLGLVSTKVVRTKRASQVKLPLTGALGGTQVAGVSAARPSLTKEQAVMRPGTAVEPAQKMGVVGESTPSSSMTMGTFSITHRPGKNFRENELVKKGLVDGGKAAGYIFFMDVPQKGHVVTVIRLNSLEFILPI